ncbi:MAG: dicarboxylate/amino acid:cation symporter [Alistipes sp.]|nr:dicarboxylate/amino acid:cation symporter [Alistipes sp.]
MKRLPKLGLLWRVALAIGVGILCASFVPIGVAQGIETINQFFAQMLGFLIPLIILGLISPSIAEMGPRAGRLLGATVLLAFGSTLFAGFLSYFTCQGAFPWLLSSHDLDAVPTGGMASLKPYFILEIPPLMGVMTAIVLAFTIGMAAISSHAPILKQGLNEFRDLTYRIIRRAILPFLPFYIFCIFFKIAFEGQISTTLTLFLRIIVLIFVMHILLLWVQYLIAALVAHKNPIRLLRNMLPAYATALGTQSSVATIPVTLAQTLKNGVAPDLANFVIPLNATIHLSGSILKIVACAMAICWTQHLPTDLPTYIGFILLLSITMIAAPGVPGGAIMAVLGVLASCLGFDSEQQGLMIALYITMDSFGTAGNVTGDGALAVILDRLYQKHPSPPLQTPTTTSSTH